MNTGQLERVLASDPFTRRVVSGVYARDHLPSIPVPRQGRRTRVAEPWACIINTDTCLRPGEHWVAVFVDVNHPHARRGEYFDSYGMAPQHDDVITWLNRITDHWTWNDRRLQSLDTSVCGQYCVYYLTQRARGRSMDAIVHTFDTSCTTYENDLMVFDWVDRQFDIHPTLFFAPQ